MGFWGAVVGGVVGGVFGGPIGAGLGAALGGAIDGSDEDQLPMNIQWLDDTDGRLLIFHPQSMMHGVVGYIIHLVHAESSRYVSGRATYKDEDGDFRAIAPASGPGEPAVLFVPRGAARVPSGQPLHLRVTTFGEHGPLGVSVFETDWPTGNYSRCALLRPVIGLSMRVARADGRLDRTEVSLIRKTLTEAFELDRIGQEQLRDMMKAEPSEPLEEQVVKIFQRLPDVPLDAVLSLLADVALADGEVAESEIAVVRAVALEMGLDPAGWNPVAASLGLTSDRARLEEALAVLGLASDSTLAQAKSAFRTKIRDYHPDKFTSLPVEFQEVAHRKSQELNDAWSTVRSIMS